MTAPLLAMAGIRKAFPGVVALDDVSLSLAAGEVLALIGENGAGKSTLMRILAGVLPPDAGEIRLDGAPIRLRSPADARRHGIALIHQELSVVANLDVGANLFLGREPVRGGPLRLVDRRAIAERARPWLAELGLEVDPGAPMAGLSLAQRQLVEIAKALSLEARALVMDEPTSSLTLSETERLLATVARLRGRGVGIVYVSHRLGEIVRCADRVVALRDGRNAGELARAEIGHEAMVRLMVGRGLAPPAPRAAAGPRPALLRVEGLRTRRFPHRVVSLELRAGEILGLAGLVGAGRSGVALALAGIEPPLAGTIALAGAAAAIASPRDAIALGIALVPEDRRGAGLVVDHAIRANLTLPTLARHATAGFVHPAREEAAARASAGSLRVKTPSLAAAAATLSGGNQQKVVLAKWLALSPRVLIVDEPTRGIDVGAKAEIHRLLRELADGGVALLMISSDLEEVLAVSDRIAVMHEGAIDGVLEPSQFSEEAVMRLAVGAAAVSTAGRPAVSPRAPTPPSP